MTPERMRQVEDIFHAARERAPSEQTAFIAQACAGDDALHREVELLIIADEQAVSLIELPAYQLAAPLLIGEHDKSLIGKSLAHYQIVALLGQGGMGEVYQARDTRLDRTVALKILPAEVAADAERMRRFIREAKAASALNHPNVAHIYEIGEAEGLSFIAMECVEGQTLAAKINGQPLEVSEIVEIGSQIADALDEAHSKGITHRDIKPANVMLNERGQVKVLDFGLAKIARPTQPISSDISTLAKTAPGVVMGTVPYMSPEQALGREVDQRSDLFSLGVVLYEMATGRLPFAGTNTSELLDRILHAQPEAMARFNYDVPAELERIVRKCLEKERERRYQSARELLVDLKNLKRDSDSKAAITEQVAASPKRRLSHQSLAVIALVILTLAGGAAWGLYKFVVRDQSHTSSSKPDPIVIPITSSPGSESQPAFSPDGKQIAFVGDGPQEDNPDIYVKLVDAGEPLRLTTNPAPDLNPVWSPDGRYLAFTREGAGSGVYLVPALGGAERKLADIFPRRPYYQLSLSYSPDGKFLAVADKTSAVEPYGIFLLDAQTGGKRRLTSPPAGSVGDECPAFSADGKSLAFARMLGVGMKDIYVVPVAGGEPRRLTFDDTQTAGLTWTSDSREIVFSSNRSGIFHLWRVPLAGSTPTRVNVYAQNLLHPTTSRQGDRLAWTQRFSDSNIWRIEITNPTGPKTAPVKLIASTMNESNPQYSPDGQRIAFASNRSGSFEIWACDREGRNPIQLTSLGTPDTGTPRWSPDGQQITFDCMLKGNREIYLISANGGQARQLTTEPAEDTCASWSRDGRWIYFCSSRSGSLQIWKMPSTGGAAMQVTRQGGFEGFESPDGKYFYYAKGRVTPGIWRIPVAGGEEAFVLDHHEAGYWRYWAVTEQGIYFATATTPTRPVIEFFSFATHEVTPVAIIERRIGRGFWGLAVSPDSRWIVYEQLDQSGSDIMLMENFR